MSRNTNSLRVQLRKCRKNRLGQFVRDVSVHVVASVVGRLGCVDVEARSRAEVVGVVFALNVEAAYTNRIQLLVSQSHKQRGEVRTRASIRVQHGDTVLACTMLEKALLGAVIRRAGQTREVNEQRNLLGGLADGLRGEVQVEAHFAVGGLGGMAELEELAAERRDCCFGCDGHGELCV